MKYLLIVSISLEGKLNFDDFIGDLFIYFGNKGQFNFESGQMIHQ